MDLSEAIQSTASNLASEMHYIADRLEATIFDVFVEADTGGLVDILDGVDDTIQWLKYDLVTRYESRFEEMRKNFLQNKEKKNDTQTQDKTKN